MTLKDKLQEDLKSALKNKEALRLSVIRLAKAAITNLEINRGHQLEDAEVIEVLNKEAKQRKDAIPEYEKAARTDIVDKLKQELQILEEYLPAQLSEAEIRQLVEETVQQTGATGRKDMGKLMAALMPKVKGKADGKLVNQIVTSILESN
ncbi:MAG TPA: GatB/YqeY domain-containing protein [Bacillota bacterium]|nr:GatB/YqeY domain-containing protein [Bacillota bacterium]